MTDTGGPTGGSLAKTVNKHQANRGIDAGFPAGVFFGAGAECTRSELAMGVTLGVTRNTLINNNVIIQLVVRLIRANP